LLALAIGGTTVTVGTLAIAIPFHDPLDLRHEWDGYLLEMLLVALPFIALALLAEPSRLLWSSALALTILPWSFYVFEAIDYRREGSSVLAHMGFDVLLSLLPIVVALIVVAISLIGRWMARASSEDAGATGTPPSRE